MAQNVAKAVADYIDAERFPQTVQNQVQGALITKFNEQLKELRNFFLSIKSTEYPISTHQFQDEKITVNISFYNFPSRCFEIKISDFVIYDSYDSKTGEFDGINISPENSSVNAIKTIVKSTNHFFKSIDKIEESILKDMDSYISLSLENERRRLNYDKNELKEKEKLAEILFGGEEK